MDVLLEDGAKGKNEKNKKGAGLSFLIYHFCPPPSSKVLGSFFPRFYYVEDNYRSEKKEETISSRPVRFPGWRGSCASSMPAFFGMPLACTSVGMVLALARRLLPRVGTRLAGARFHANVGRGLARRLRARSLPTWPRVGERRWQPWASSGARRWMCREPVDNLWITCGKPRFD